MKVPTVSPSARALFRALIARSGMDRDRILLISVRSTDWQSLTFTGERHEMQLGLIGEDAASKANRLVDGICDAEFDLAGSIVADIRAEPAAAREDGSVLVTIEALTVYG